MVVLPKLMKQFNVSEHGTVFHFRSVIPLTEVEEMKAEIRHA